MSYSQPWCGGHLLQRLRFRVKPLYCQFRSSYVNNKIYLFINNYNNKHTNSKKNIIRKKTMKKSRLPLNKHFLNLKVHYWLVRFFQYFYKNIYSAVHKVLLNLVWLFKFELTYHKLLYLKLLKQITIYLKFKNLKFIGVYFFYIFLLWFVFQI